MRRQIVVVDDDPGILEAFEAMLESAGYDVVLYSSADQLQALSSQHQPDLIILDVLLSGVDGRDVCKSIKQDPKTSNIPILMISAHPTAGDGAFVSGAQDYLKKPFEMDLLLSKVAALLK